MNALLRNKSFRLAAILTFIFLGTGTAFLHFGISDYGFVLFMILPIVLGISIGALPSKKFAFYAFMGSVALFLIFLAMMGLEGYICILMALIIIIPLVFLGSVIVHLIQRYIKLKSSDKLPILILPLLIFVLGAPLERFLNANKKEVIEVKSEMILFYSNMKVYDAIKSVDTLIAEKGLLMKIDLPIPQKCVLEKEEIGGLRTCYFSGGQIVEKITELQKGKVLRMDVIGYELTGREWLGFEEAIYTFDSLDIAKCKITRITTYTSELKPRFYWGPLEKMGIKEEHQYVLNNLRRDLEMK